MNQSEKENAPAANGGDESEDRHYQQNQPITEQGTIKHGKIKFAVLYAIDFESIMEMVRTRLAGNVLRIWVRLNLEGSGPEVRQFPYSVNNLVLPTR